MHGLQGLPAALHLAHCLQSASQARHDLVLSGKVMPADLAGREGKEKSSHPHGVQQGVRSKAGGGAMPAEAGSVRGQLDAFRAEARKWNDGPSRPSFDAAAAEIEALLGSKPAAAAARHADESRVAADSQGMYIDFIPAALGTLLGVVHQVHEACLYVVESIC